MDFFNKIEFFRNNTKISHLLDLFRTDDENLLWKRNLLVLSLSQFIAMIGMGACVPFLPLYVKELGITNPDEIHIWSGFVFAGPYFLSIIAVPVWGAMGDRYGRKLMVFRAIIGLAIAVFLMGFAQNVYQLFALRILQGAVSGFIAAAMAFVSADTPPSRRGYSLGILQSASSAGNIIGPLFGGAFSDIFGIRQVFFIVGILCVLGGILVMLFVREKIRNDDEKIQVSILSNLKYVLKTKELNILIILIILSQAGIYFPTPIFPFYIESLHAPAQYLSTITGVLVGIIGIFSIFFAPWWGQRNDRRGYKKTLLVSSLVSGTALLLHYVVPHYLLLIPLRGLLGIFFAGILPSLYSAISKKAPADITGGIMGIASSATLLASFISFSLCGFAASAFGINFAFIISGFLLLSVALFTGFLKEGK